MNKWISVKDQLPKDEQIILTTDGKYYCIKQMEFGALVHLECDYGCGVKYTTHWMTLPELPHE